MVPTIQNMDDTSYLYGIHPFRVAWPALKDGSYFSRHWTKYPYSCSIETLKGPNSRPVNSQCKVKQILCPIGRTMFDEFFSKEFFPSSPILKPRSSENKSWVSQVISTPVCVCCCRCCCCRCCHCCWCCCCCCRSCSTCCSWSCCCSTWHDL